MLILNCNFQAGMNPNFVRKRKDDSICGPYEAQRKSLRPSVIVNKMPKDQEKMLNDLNILWRALSSTALEWTHIRESNNVMEYINCIKGKITQSFITKLDHFQAFPPSLKTDIISKAGNEIAMLYLSRFFQKEIQTLKIGEAEIDQETLCYGFQMDETIVNRIFYYLNKHTELIDKECDHNIVSIIAGILLFAPDRGYRYSEYNMQTG